MIPVRQQKGDEMFIDILKLILPIIVMLLVGMAAKKWNWFSMEGAKAFRNIVGKVMLPAVLLDAFIFADYSTDILVIGGMVLLWMLAALALGFPARKLMKKHGKYLPFLVTADEVGMLGYSLIGLLFGSAGIASMALCDLGHTFFVFAIAVPLLQAFTGQKATVKSVVSSILHSFPFDAMMIGIILGLLGVGRFIDANPAVGSIYHALIDMISGPTTALILISLGYELAFRKEVMKSVVQAYAIRLAIMAGVGALCSFLIFRFVPYSKPLMTSLLLLVTLPPSFSMAIFGDLGEDAEFVSTTMSFGTLVGLVLYIAVSVFALS